MGMGCIKYQVNIDLYILLEVLLKQSIYLLNKNMRWLSRLIGAPEKEKHQKKIYLRIMNMNNKIRSKKIMISIVILTVILWLMTVAIINYSLRGGLILLIFSIVASISSICIICVWLIRKIKPGISPYKLFGIADMVIEGMIIIYAVYDMLTDTGMMAGIKGFLLLFFVAPIPLVLLIIDIILYVKCKKKNDIKSTVSEDSRCQ